MLGVGAPPALQLNVSSRPSRTVRFSGGDSITGADAKIGRKTEKTITTNPSNQLVELKFKSTKSYKTNAITNRYIQVSVNST